MDTLLHGISRNIPDWPHRSTKKYENLRTLDLTLSCNVFQTAQRNNEGTKNLKKIFILLTEFNVLVENVAFSSLVYKDVLPLQQVSYVTTEILLSCNTASDSYFCFN